MLTLHEPKFENYDITTIRTSSESHLLWKDHFHKNPINLRIYAHFEADNEIDISGVEDKTTNIYKQNPLLNGYHIMSEIEDVLKSGYYESLSGYDNVDWFVIEVIKLENKMAFYFKNTKKDIIMTEKNEEDFRKKNICRICEKERICDKFGDHCHLTGKYGGPAHNTCYKNVTQKQSNLYHLYFTILLTKIKSYWILYLRQMKNIYR